MLRPNPKLSPRKPAALGLSTSSERSDLVELAQRAVVERGGAAARDALVEELSVGLRGARVAPTRTIAIRGPPARSPTSAAVARDVDRRRATVRRGGAAV